MIALLRGQSLCAVFSAMANIVLLTVNTDDLSVAFYCFSLTILLHLGAFFALAGVTKTAFFFDQGWQNWVTSFTRCLRKNTV